MTRSERSTKVGKTLCRGLVAFLFVVHAWAVPTSVSAASDAGHVVLVHGLGRGDGAMYWLERRLEDEGFVTHRLEYDSLRDDPAQIIAAIDSQMDQCCGRTGGPVHFVGHSLGGLVVRAYLDRHGVPGLGRVVLMGTPNQGSELVDRWGDRWFMKLLGPTAAELGTQPGGFADSIGPPYYEVGVIAGTRSLNPLGSSQLPGADDGTVSVASTRLVGMSDFIEIDTTHSFMLYSSEVADEVVYFLRHGRFSRSSLPAR